MSDIIIVGGKKDIEIFADFGKGDSISVDFTYFDLMEYYISVNTIPVIIQKTRQQMEELAIAMTSLCNENKKIVINELSPVNPNQRLYKNKRKW